MFLGRTLGGDSLFYIHLFTEKMQENKSRTIKNRNRIPDYVIPLLKEEYEKGKKDGRKEGILFCRGLIAKGLGLLDDVLSLNILPEEE